MRYNIITIIIFKTFFKEKSKIILYTIWTILASLIPVFGFTGKFHISIPSAIIIFLLGLWMLFYAFKLYNKIDSVAARKLMLVSVSYITLLQIIYVIDKFI